MKTTNIIRLGVLAVVLCASSSLAYFDGPGGYAVKHLTAPAILNTNGGASLAQAVPVVPSAPPAGGIMTLSLPVPGTLPTNNIPASYLSLADVELKTNAMLDELVQDYQTNALALYGYVLNQVDLRNDPRVVNNSTRGALGSYLEQEGHDVDLCSLTMYLLRRCGIPCAYGFLPQPQLTPEDYQQVYGYEVVPPGAGYCWYPGTTNTIVYAFVSTNGVSTNWVALVPWWKKRTFIEGAEFRDFLTNNYQTGLGIVSDYLRRRTTLEPYVTNTTDLLADFFPELLKSILASNSPNTSLDQVGVRWRLAEQVFTNWPTDYDIELDTGATVTASASLSTSQYDRVSMKLTKNGGGVMLSNTFYTCQLHNRRVLVSFEPATSTDWAKVTNGFYEAGTNFNMVGTLSLGPSPQFNGGTITGSVSQTVRMGDSVTMTVDSGQRTFGAGSYECYVFNFGRVTDAMLDQHYKVLDDLSALTKSTTNLVWSNVDARKLLGEQLCTVGMNYYLLLDESSRQLEEWTKTRSGGASHVGSFYFNLATKAGSTFLADSMSIDAFNLRVNGMAYLHQQGSATTGVYRSSEPEAQERDWFSLAALSMSTFEHGILQKAVGFQDAMSSDKCLRMAVEGGGFVTNLTATTYTAPQNQQIISNVDAGAYATVRSFFTNHPQGQLWFPSRQITNASYAGYGWVEVDVNTNNSGWSAAYKITGGNHGGRSQTYTEPAYQSTSWTQTGNNSVPVSATTPPQTLITAYRTTDGVSVNYAGNFSSPTVNYVATSSGSASSQYSLNATVGSVVWGATYEREYWSQINSFYTGSGLSGGSLFQQSDATALTRGNDSGFHGTTTLGQQLQSAGSTMSDPVDTRTGEAYVDDIDLTIQGPKPIEFRRAYSSKYAAIGEFGYGWRFNHSCYLAINTNATEIRAVEPDGSVLRYTNSGANAWTVSLALNAHLANENEHGIGSTANPFVNRIEKSVQSGATNYTLTTADGQVRTYTVKSYSDGVLTRNRPYLTKWVDPNSNTLSYAYGADSNRFDFGRITEIHNANHFVKTKYNSAGRLWQVICDDGRVLQYEYSPAGDLSAVKRPDGSFVYYDYKDSAIPRHHYSQLDGNGDYMQAPDIAALRLTTGMTVEAWIRVDANSADWARLVGKGNSTNRNYGLWREADGDILFQICSAGGTLNLWRNGGKGDSANIAVGSGWHHIAGTYDKSVAKLYIDGQVILSTNYTQTPYTSADPLTVGYATFHTNFNGKIDDVLIWNHARTQTQVQQDMDNTPTGAVAGLVGGYTFDNNTAQDISANQNHGTFYGDMKVKWDKDTYSTHLICRETKPGGRVLENTYDDQRRVIEQKATVGLSATPVRNATFTYLGDGDNGTTIASNILGAATVHAYSNGLIVRVTDALGFSESNEWDAARNLISHTDKRGVTTRFAYDARGNATNVLLIGDLAGNGVATTSITWMTYTTNNLVSSKTTPRGDVTRFYYDARRNLVTQELCRADADPWNPTNNSVFRTDVFQYNAQGKITNKTVAAGTADAVATAYVYDQDGNLAQSALDPGQGQQVITYNCIVNTRGWVTRKTDPTGAYSTYDYDAMGRIATRSDYSSGGSLLDRRTFGYDENGNVLSEDGPRTYVDDSVTRAWDRQDRLVSESRSRYNVGFSGGYPYYTYLGQAVASSVYDGFGNLIQTTDPNGNVAKHVYDAEGQRTDTTNYQGSGSTALSAVHQWYDAGGLVSSNKTPRGYVVRTTYNAQGKPILKVNADGAVEQWRCDLAGQVTQYINPRSIQTRYQYDDFGRLTNRIEAAGTAQERSFAFTYDLRGNLIATRDPQGFMSSSIYDRADRVVAEIGAAGASPQVVWSNRYDGAGRLIMKIGASSFITNAYDGLGRVALKAMFGNGSSTPDYYELFTYSIFDYNDVKRVNYGGIEYQFDWLDESGKVGARVYHDSTRKLFRYDNKGNLTQQIDELSRTNLYTLDGLDRVATITTPDGATVTNQYDADGNTTNTLYPLGVAYLRQYDPKGRLTAERVAGTGQGSLFNYAYGYDASGNVVTQTTARGVSIVSTFDALDRRTGVAADAPTPLIPSVSQSFSYTANGWLETATDGNRTAKRLFDQYGKALAETNTTGGSTLSFDQTFDAQGRRLTCHIGPANESWSYKWNGAQRVTNVNWSGADFGIAYDQQGRLISQSGPYASVENEWGVRHTLTHRTYYDPYNTWFNYYEETAAYRADIQRTAHAVYYDGWGALRTNAFGYDSLNQVTTEVLYADSSTRITNRYEYDSASLRTNFVKNTTTGSWQRASGPDAFRRLSTETTAATGSNPIITVSGQVLDSTNVLVRLNGATVGYARVDTNSRLWTLSGLQLSGGTNVVTATADSDKAWATNAASTVTLNLYVRGSYVYDADGNLVYVNRGNKDYTYTFDALGRLVAATLRDSGGNGWNWTAAYDALNRRAQTTYATVTSNTASGASTASTLWDPLNPMQEVYRQDQYGNVFHLYGPDLSDTVGGLGGIGGLLALRDYWGVLQLMSDLRGNVIGGTDWYDIYKNPPYSAFGFAGSLNLSDSPSYSSRRVDETGLIFMGARYYDQVTGRFLSPDPSRFSDSRNLYAAFKNDGANNQDPDGKCNNNRLEVYNPSFGGNASYQGVGLNVNQLQVNPLQLAGHATAASGPVVASMTVPGAGLAMDAQAMADTSLSPGWRALAAVSFVANLVTADEGLPNAGAFIRSGERAVEAAADTASSAVRAGQQLEFQFVNSMEQYNPSYVIYKASEFDSSMLRSGEYTLNLPNLGNTELNWAQNQQALERAMSIGNPIREANPLASGGFLQRERDFLDAQGWQRVQQGGDFFWVKPSGQ